MVGRYQVSKEVLEEGIHHIVKIKIVVSCNLHQHRWGLEKTKYIGNNNYKLMVTKKANTSESN